MIHIKDVDKSINGHKILMGLSTDIPKGSIFGLVGANGAGKSTLLRCIMGIYKINSGIINIHGMSTFDNDAIKQKMFYVPDDLYFLENATALDMARYYHEIYNSFNIEKFHHLANLLQLDMKQDINGFSKGMKRKSAMVLALACDCDYYFFDETFDGLDSVVRKAIKDLIKEESKNRKTTFVISSHNLRELDDLCDNMGLLYKGAIPFQTTKKSLKGEFYKLQVVCSDIDDQKFPGVIMNCSQLGQVKTYIVKGEKEKIEQFFKQYQPVLMDWLKLSMEEMFIYEMEVLGYEFKDNSI